MTKAAKDLIITLFFLGDSITLGNLVKRYENIHSAICQIFGRPRNQRDYRDSLQELEGSFLIIADGRVGFINPSIVDYLDRQFGDRSLLRYVIPHCCKASEIVRIWEFIVRHKATIELSPGELAGLLEAAVPALLEAPVWTSDTEAGQLRLTDVGLPKRIEMLMDWIERFGEARFGGPAIRALGAMSEGKGLWSDAGQVARLLQRLDSMNFRNLPIGNRLRDEIEECLRKLVHRGGVEISKLETIYDQIDSSGDKFSRETLDIVIEAIREEIDTIESSISQIDNEYELEENVKTLRKLARRASINFEVPRDVIVKRRREIQENMPPDDEDIEYHGSAGGIDERPMSDLELTTLFSYLK